MITLMLLGFSLSNIDGYDLKMCHYHHQDLPQTLSMALPLDEECKLKLEIGN